MSEEQKVIFYEWPNGMRSIAGGTRAAIKLSRPWQEEIKPHKGNCPFCDPNDPARLQYFEKAGGWWLRQNIFTPYPFHQMVVPAQCLEPKELRTLGGKEKIKAALEIALGAAQGSGAPSIVLNVHVGALGGQNLTHLHWHVVQYNLIQSDYSFIKRIRNEWLNWYFDSQKSWELKRPDLAVYRNRHFTAVIGGVKAGQCLILPSAYPPRETSPAGWGVIWAEYDDPIQHFLVDAINEVVSLYNKRFLSVEGLEPDFNIAIHCGGGGGILYAEYTPILNHWGSAEHMALYEGWHITLPWPHEMTAQYLRGEIEVKR